MTSALRDRIIATPAMIAVFDDASTLDAALAFEGALAQALAAEHLLDGDLAIAIAVACANIRIDPVELADAAALAGTLAIPLVQRLREALAHNAAAAAAVHRGATSQDLADTVLVLQARQAMSLLLPGLARIATALEATSTQHAATGTIGRTLLQDALPIGFGLKAANWLAGVAAARRRVQREADAALRLQFGGAAGALHGLQGKGDAVAVRIAAALDLGLPVPPWHARREAIGGLGAALGILIGTLAKIARDIALSAQNAIGELREPAVAGRGGSSAMAHKRNPTGCQVALSAALRAPGLVGNLLAALPQEHERGLGGWQIEAATLAELFLLADGAVAAMATVLEGLEIDTAAMQANLAKAGVGADIGESERLVAELLRSAKESG